MDTGTLIEILKSVSAICLVISSKRQLMLSKGIMPGSVHRLQPHPVMRTSGNAMAFDAPSASISLEQNMASGVLSCSLSSLIYL